MTHKIDFDWCLVPGAPVVSVRMMDDVKPTVSAVAYGQRGWAKNIEGDTLTDLLGDPSGWGLSPHDLFKHASTCICDACCSPHSAPTDEGTG